jgi:hypothetical protein
MECPFHIGQKVVCVNDTGVIISKYIKKGNIYTVSFIGEYDAPYQGVYVALVEVITSTSYTQGDFYHWRFRPLQETKTDISIFNKMLTPAPKESVKEVRRKIKENV